MRGVRIVGGLATRKEAGEVEEEDGFMTHAEKTVGTIIRCLIILATVIAPGVALVVVLKFPLPPGVGPLVVAAGIAVSILGFILMTWGRFWHR